MKMPPEELRQAVIDRLADGMFRKTIAEELGVSQHTVQVIVAKHQRDTARKIPGAGRKAMRVTEEDLNTPAVKMALSEGWCLRIRDGEMTLCPPRRAGEDEPGETRRDSITRECSVQGKPKPGTTFQDPDRSRWYYEHEIDTERRAR